MHYKRKGRLIGVLRLDARPANRYTEYELFGKGMRIHIISLPHGIIVESTHAGFIARRCTSSGVQEIIFNHEAVEIPYGWNLDHYGWRRVYDLATSNSRMTALPSLLMSAEEAKEAARHEDDLVNHRTGWFVSTQGLLFASLAFAWKDAEQVVLPFAVLGLFLGISAVWAARCSNRAFYRAELHHPSAPGYSILQDNPKFGFLGVWSLPWNAFPVLFIVAWLWIGYHCVRRKYAPDDYKNDPTAVKIIDSK